MRQRYALPVGFSDHTNGPAAAIAAAALGARVVEKHFTFSRLMYGSDAANGMEPEDFRRLAASLHEVWAMLANPVDKDEVARYAEMKRIFEKSVVATRPVAAETALCREDLAFKKPGDGIPAARWRSLIGRRLRHGVAADHKFTEADFL
jgi:N-acetylneuraminate synthase